MQTETRVQALEMFKKIDADEYKKFWAEYGTALKLGLVEDHNNRVRISKLLRCACGHSAASRLTHSQLLLVQVDG